MNIGTEHRFGECIPYEVLLAEVESLLDSLGYKRAKGKALFYKTEGEHRIFADLRREQPISRVPRPAFYSFDEPVMAAEEEAKFNKLVSEHFAMRPKQIEADLTETSELLLRLRERLVAVENMTRMLTELSHQEAHNVAVPERLKNEPGKFLDLIGRFEPQFELGCGAKVLSGKCKRGTATVTLPVIWWECEKCGAVLAADEVELHEDDIVQCRSCHAESHGRKKRR